MTPVLAANQVSRTYPGGVQALRDVSLSIQEGEMVGIVGPSGSGKSTLLQLMGTLDRPSQSRIEIRGHDVATLPDRKEQRFTRGELQGTGSSAHLRFSRDGSRLLLWLGPDPRSDASFSAASRIPAISASRRESRVSISAKRRLASSLARRASCIACWIEAVRSRNMPGKFFLEK